MIEQLFGSKTRVKLLRLFYSNPNRSFYVREITRKVDEQINSVRRELSNLLSVGIISSSEDNTNRLYYEVNQSFEHYKPLSMIFGSGVTGSKKTGTGKSDQDDDLKALGNVELALLTGQFTRDETSGVDVLLVGDINATQLEKYMAELEKKEGKELRYTVMTPKQFTYRRQVNDRFLSLVLGSKIQVLVDKGQLLATDDHKPQTKKG